MAIDYRKLIWLMPAAYAVHIAEEYFGGFPGWVTDVLGGSMDDGGFALNNAVFMIVLVTLTTWTSQTGSQFATGLLVFWASANLFWNAIFHLATVVIFDRYSPGLVTAALLYIPVTIAVGDALVRQRALPIASLICCWAGGAGIMGFVIWAGLYHFAT